MTYKNFLNRSDHTRVFLIAEAGVNHENSLDDAKKMIELAAKAGCDAIKFQTYKADQISSKLAKSYWDTNAEIETNQHQLFSKYDKFEFEDYVELKKHCDDQNIEFSTTVFDHNEISKYSNILSFFKIASADISNLPLLRAIAKEKKPVIISTGASSIGEIEFAVNLFSNQGINTSILHCVLNYPCRAEDASLKKIKYLKKVFPNKIIGYSDHVAITHDNLHLHTARLLGARIIEKHFSLDKSKKGNDHYHSFEYKDIIKYRDEEKFISKLINNNYLDLTSQTTAIENARRSIVAKRKIKKNEKIDYSNIEIKRPGTGISPLYLDDVLGMIVTKEISEDEPIKWEDFK